MPELTLYFFHQCPFCRRVLAYLDVNNIDIELRNIRENAEYRHELVSIGGDDQVPCLVIDGKPLYESDDIIQWLKDNDDKVPKKAK